MSGLKRYFEEGYLRRWGLEPATDFHLDRAAGLVRLAGLDPPFRALDLGCGSGRYSLGMARQGADVVGMDASRAVLRLARTQQPRPERSHGPDDSHGARPGAAPDPVPLGTPVRWVRADMRALPFRRAFDLVICLNAFGYFEVEGEDLDCLRAVRDVMVPGGRLVLRNPNGELIRREFRPTAEERQGEVRVHIESTLYEGERWLAQRLEMEGPKGASVYHRHQRLYSATELEHVLGQAGFTAVRRHADERGAPFVGPHSPQMVTTARA